MNNTVKHIEANPCEVGVSLTNPRGREFRQHPDWPEFVASVRQHGVTQWPVVRLMPAARTDPGAKGMKYELVQGERRVTAAVEAGLAKINVVLRELSDAEAVELQQIENLQRADLSALEEAQGYADWRDTLLQAKTCATVEAAVEYIAAKISRKRSTVFGRLALLKTTPAVQEALKSGRLDLSKAGLLATIPDAKAQAAALKWALEEDYNDELPSYRDLQRHVEQKYRISLKDAPFQLQQKLPDGKGGTLPVCEGCPHHEDKRCLNPSCFSTKKAAAADLKVRLAREAGQTVLSPEDYKRKQKEFVGAGDWEYTQNRNGTWESLMGKHKPKAVLVTAASGELVTVYPKVEALAAAKKNGVKFRAEDTDTMTPEQLQKKKEKEQAAALERRQRERTAVVIADLAVKRIEQGPCNEKTELALWRFVFGTRDFENVFSGDNEWSHVAERRGLPAESLQKATEKFTVGQYRSFLAEMLAVGYNGGFTEDAEYSDRFETFCQFAGVDLKKSEKAALETVKKNAATLVDQSAVKALREWSPADTRFQEALADANALTLQEALKPEAGQKVCRLSESSWKAVQNRLAELIKPKQTELAGLPAATKAKIAGAAKKKK